MKDSSIRLLILAVAGSIFVAGCATVRVGAPAGSVEGDETTDGFVRFYRETAAQTRKAGGDEVGGIGSPMDADYPAGSDDGIGRCTAIRVVWTGRLVDDAALEALYATRMPGADRNKEPGTLDDLDGDGRPEMVREYELDGSRPDSIPDGVKPPCGKAWPVMKFEALPSIWIISYSSGRHSIIEPTFYNIRAKSE